MANLFIIAAPSGCGKTSLVEALIKKTKNLCVSVSHTTRPPRPDEVNGINYYFVSINEFEEMIKNNAFVEHATVFDNHYGSSTKLISEKLNKNVDVILEIDWQGARQVKENMPNSVSIFIYHPLMKHFWVDFNKEHKIMTKQSTKECLTLKIRCNTSMNLITL